jgi:hypothetical protein
MNHAWHCWKKHGGIAPSIVFILTLFLLPWLPVTKWLYNDLIVPLTDGIVPMLNIKPLDTAIDEPLYYWILSGLFVNIVSIALAIFMVFRSRKTDKFDLIFFGIYITVFFGSIGLMLSFRWTANYMVRAFFFYYLIYVATDAWGTVKNWSSNYERAKYLYPLFCLDVPALLASIVILLTAIRGPFVDGMAAGHLVFGSFCYLGIAGLMLPFILERIDRADEALRRAQEAVTQMPGEPDAALTNITLAVKALSA